MKVGQKILASVGDRGEMGAIGICVVKDIFLVCPCSVRDHQGCYKILHHPTRRWIPFHFPFEDDAKHVAIKLAEGFDMAFSDPKTTPPFIAKWFDKFMVTMYGEKEFEKRRDRNNA